MAAQIPQAETAALPDTTTSLTESEVVETGIRMQGCPDIAGCLAAKTCVYGKCK